MKAVAACGGWLGQGVTAGRTWIACSFIAETTSEAFASLAAHLGAMLWCGREPIRSRCGRFFLFCRALADTHHREAHASRSPLVEHFTAACRGESGTRR